jgi:hypothetical protein
MGKGRADGATGGRRGGIAVLARAIALVYGLLGLVTLIVGTGLVSGWWNVYQLFGGVIERHASIGLFERLFLPAALAARDLADESGVLLVAIGAFHLAAGGLFLVKATLGRPLLLILSGFYIFTFVLHISNVHFSHHEPVGMPLGFLVVHVLCFAVVLGRAASGGKGRGA